MNMARPIPTCINGKPRKQSVSQCRMIVTSIGVIALIFMFSQGCKKDMEFHSQWRQQEITIDGNDAEWQDHLTWIEGHPVAIGIKNDDTDLYLFITTTDHNMKQTLMRRGLTIWFNADGKKKKTFGIRYPIGLAAHQQWRSYDPDEWRMDERERLEIHMADMLKEMEIIGPGDHARNHTFIENPYGISMALTDTAAAIIYELKIPLQASGGHPYQIGAKPGSTIRVGLETGGIGGQMITRSGGGQGGMAGGQPTAVRSGGSPGGGRQIPAQLPELWLELHLATEK
jgi:hypothetical protein